MYSKRKIELSKLLPRIFLVCLLYCIVVTLLLETPNKDGRYKKFSTVVHHNHQPPTETQVIDKEERDSYKNVMQWVQFLDQPLLSLDQPKVNLLEEGVTKRRRRPRNWNPAAEARKRNHRSLLGAFLSQAEEECRSGTLRTLNRSGACLDSFPAKEVAVVSAWRSGSTMLGELLSASPVAFYHYEPFLSRGNTVVRGEEAEEAARDRLEKLMDCRYSALGGTGSSTNICIHFKWFDIFFAQDNTWNTPSKKGSKCAGTLACLPLGARPCSARF